jgi:RNA polymerase sigma-70 factor (ECF subfamily)
MGRAKEAEERTGVEPPARAEVDLATLTRCRAQDPVAFQAFVTRYERLVFAVLSQMLGHGSHVEDLAQEAFLRAYLAFPRFDPGGPRPSRWLLTIATRLAVNDGKRRGRRAPSADPAPEPATWTTPESESVRGELGRAIERAIAELPADRRAVFVLAELHDLPLAEIALVLGIPENTVKTRLFRARERLRALLGPQRNGGHG